MGKTYRNFSDDDSRRKKSKQPRHTDGKRSGGMKVVNNFYDEGDDYFDDGVSIEDTIVINKSRDESS